MIELIKDNPVSLEFDISSAITALDLEDINDVTDAMFVLKNKQQDPDDSSLISKTITGGGIEIAGGKLYVPLVKADYTNLTPGSSYHIALGIKYEGVATFLELDLQGEDRIRIKQDTIRG